MKGIRALDCKKRYLLITLIIAVALTMASCNKSEDSKPAEETSANTESSDSKEEPSEEKSEDATEEESEETETEEPAEKEPAEEEPAEAPEEKNERSAKQKEEYLKVLRNLEENHLAPEITTPLPGDNFSENKFTVMDVDGDGEEELLFDFNTGSMAEQFEAVYHYNTYSNTLETKLYTFPNTVYYEDGYVMCMASHNHSLSLDFWPYILMHFSPNAGEYVEVAKINAWDKSYMEKDYYEKPFPTELDEDGDGILVYILERGVEPSSEEYDDGSAYGASPVSVDEYEAWLDEVLGEREPLFMEWYSLTKENIDLYEQS